VDLAQLRVPSERAAVLRTLYAASRDYGFFHLVNHGVGAESVAAMLGMAARFFELPFPEQALLQAAAPGRGRNKVHLQDIILAYDLNSEECLPKSLPNPNPNQLTSSIS
jgi:isopenicillin N synthase-like dioxygenase